jgi:AraC-like DNA-binding protein
MNTSQTAAEKAIGGLNDFERFLTATVLTRCLDAGPQDKQGASDIEPLIKRISDALRDASQAVSGIVRGPSNALPRHKLRAVAEYVAANLDSPIRVSDLANLACMSPFHFSRQFREATGLAPHQYVLHCRMLRATRLLADTEMSVGMVALEVGCSDPSHFTSTFRRLFGCGPREFRQALLSRLHCTTSASAWPEAQLPR